MSGVLIILCFWLLGNALSYAIDGFIPGNILGMILLFLALIFKVVNPETVRPAATFLIKNLVVFFIPLGVGLMCSTDAVMGNLWTIVISAVISTLIVLVASGWCFQLLNHKRR